MHMGARKVQVREMCQGSRVQQFEQTIDCHIRLAQSQGVKILCSVRRRQKANRFITDAEIATQVEPPQSLHHG